MLQVFLGCFDALGDKLGCVELWIDALLVLFNLLDQITLVRLNLVLFRIDLLPFLDDFLDTIHLLSDVVLGAWSALSLVPLVMLLLD